MALPQCKMLCDCVPTSDVTPVAETVGAKTEKQRTRLDFTVTATIDDVSMSYQLSTLHSYTLHTQHTQRVMNKNIDYYRGKLLHHKLKQALSLSVGSWANCSSSDAPKLASSTDRRNATSISLRYFTYLTHTH